jgi:hypothetical protein
VKLHEPDVALTDLGLAVECAWFAGWLLRNGTGAEPIRGWFIAFFGATGVAAFLGAVVHGFVADTGSALYRALWIGIFGAVGLAAVASWAIGAHLVLPARIVPRVVIAALAVFALYVAVVLFHSRSFAVAIVHYLPAAAFLLVAFIIAPRRRAKPYLTAGIAGMALTFLAAYVQQRGIGLHALYFSPNAFYHLLQAVALLLIFLAARGLARQPTA